MSETVCRSREQNIDVRVHFVNAANDGTLLTREVLSNNVVLAVTLFWVIVVPGREELDEDDLLPLGDVDTSTLAFTHHMT